MSQYQNNLGNSAVLNRVGSFVTNQYGRLGAEGSFTQVYDSSRGASADPDDSQLRIYNIATWLGAYDLPDETEDPRKVAILGKMEYGIGGVQFEVDFDWKLGTQFSLCASFVRIKAAYSETFRAPDSVRVAAMMSSGGRASRAQTTRTYPQLLVTNAEGSAVLFPIPPMAFALNLFAEPAFYEADAVTIRFIGGASSGFSSLSSDLVSFESDAVPFLSALSGDGIRFPEAAKYVQVTTSDSENGLLFTPSFTLSL